MSKKDEQDIRVRIKLVCTTIDECKKVASRHYQISHDNYMGRKKDNFLKNYVTDYFENSKEIGGSLLHLQRSLEKILESSRSLTEPEKEAINAKKEKCKNILNDSQMPQLTKNAIQPGLLELKRTLERSSSPAKNVQMIREELDELRKKNGKIYWVEKSMGKFDDLLKQIMTDLKAE